jgi:hypothetical protein
MSDFGDTFTPELHDRQARLRDEMERNVGGGRGGQSGG